MSGPAVHDLLDEVLSGRAPAYALLYRPESGTPGMVDVLVGDISEQTSLADIPLQDDRSQALVIVPYRQLAERGFIAPDDGAPLLAMTVRGRDEVPLGAVLQRLPDVPTTVADGHFDVDDASYADAVRRIVDEEIGTGEGANFVLCRSFVADITDWSPQSGLAFFGRLLRNEQRAYWTFIIHTGRSTLVGATPERHISVDGGTAVMNPISGTYRYPSSGPTLNGLLEFLADGKETEELYMVVDEELKMMSRICRGGGRLLGPYLKEMARLAHTEYLIEGRTDRDVREILHETMFAPTVVGSPLESAARVIARHEPQGRRYYSGIAALVGHDPGGDQVLDSAILIRTAEIDPGGRLRIPAGATLVRHSNPAAEAAESRVKVASLLAALDSGPAPGYGAHPAVRAALRQRNEGIADFWSGERDAGEPGGREFEGLPVLVVDAEDTFTAMLAEQLGSLGLHVTIRRFDEDLDPAGYDLVVLGPGPGDPRTAEHHKIARLRAVVDTALALRRPFLAVCLSHQVLSRRLGLELRRRESPNQGVQRGIDLFGVRERVGFYNTFAAFHPDDKREVEGIGLVELSRDLETGEVHALRGPGFASMQFHAESVLTVDGPRVLADAVRWVLRS